MNKFIQILVLSGLILTASMSTLAEPAADSLYKRLGGYAGISAVVDDLVSRLANDQQLGRFYAHRGTDGITRENNLQKISLPLQLAGL